MKRQADPWSSMVSQPSQICELQVQGETLSQKPKLESARRKLLCQPGHTHCPTQSEDLPCERRKMNLSLYLTPFIHQTLMETHAGCFASHWKQVEMCLTLQHLLNFMLSLG